MTLFGLIAVMVATRISIIPTTIMREYAWSCEIPQNVIKGTQSGFCFKATIPCPRNVPKTAILSTNSGNACIFTLLGLFIFSYLWSQAFKRPLGILFAVSEAVMQTVRPALPKLKTGRSDPVTSPMCRTRRGNTCF